MPVTAYKFPTTTGEGYNDWLAPDNMFTSNNLRATASNLQAQGYATFVFTVADVPSSAIITDVEMSLEGKIQIAGNTVSMGAFCRQGGANIGVEWVAGAFTLTSDRAIVTLASSSPGQAYPTAAQVLQSDFAIVLRCDATDTPGLGTFLGDAVKIRLYYIEAPPVLFFVSDVVSVGIGGGIGIYNSAPMSGPPGREKVIPNTACREKHMLTQGCSERVVSAVSVSGKVISSYVITIKPIVSVTRNEKIIVSYLNTEKVIQ